MKHSIKFISTVLMLALPFAAHAACDTYMNSDHGVTLPSTITVPDSLPVGGINYSSTIHWRRPRPLHHLPDRYHHFALRSLSTRDRPANPSLSH